MKHDLVTCGKCDKVYDLTKGHDCSQGGTMTDRVEEKKEYGDAV